VAPPPARLQDRYSLRCAPHVIGVLVDALEETRRTLEIEINGTDRGDQNPAPPNDDDIGYDFVSVAGAATLDSTLEVVLLDRIGARDDLRTGLAMRRTRRQYLYSYSLCLGTTFLTDS